MPLRARRCRFSLGGTGGVGGGFMLARYFVLLGLVLEALQGREANTAADQQSELPIHPGQSRGVHHANCRKGGEDGGVGVHAD